MRVFANKLRNYRRYGVALGVPALLMALLIVAALSVNDAQAQGLGIGVDLNQINYDEPYPCNGDEPVPHNAAETIDNEHYAVFDAFWDYNHNRLSMNFCPPGAEHTITPGGRGQPDVEVTTRSASNIDIRKTVLSITDASKKTIVDTAGTSTNTISRVTYPFLPASSTQAWWLQEDDDRYLAMGFSTGLLKAAHWQTPPRGETHPVQFEFEAIELPTCLNPGEEAHFYVFETGSDTAKWDSSDTDTNDLKMNTGEYKHFNWAFTCPGIYKIQVHFKAHPSDAGKTALKIDSLDKTITSEAQLYTFHVGPEDDLGVKITPETQTVAASATSTSFTVKATNGGPSDAHDAEVQIYLPEGLDYVADSSHTGVTYDSTSGVIAWDLRRFGNADTTTRNTASPATLNFKASINRTKATGTVAARAEIRNVASEDLDPNSANDASFAAVRMSSTHVHPPIFTVKREIEEFASAFEHVGDPVMAFSPEMRTLTYSLSGRGHEKFKVLGNGQIIVANNVLLEYEKQWSYWLTLKASDGTNSDTVLVKIRVLNVPGPKVRIWLEDERPGPEFPIANLMHPSASDESLISLNAKVHNLPAGKTPGGCWWDAGLGRFDVSYAGGSCHILPDSDSAGPVTYTMGAWWTGGSAFGTYTINWAP